MNHKTSFFSLLAILFVSGFSSCISLVNYQSGKTLGKGRTELIVYKEYTGAKKRQTATSQADIFRWGGGGAGVGVRHGFTDRLDAGLRVNSLYQVGVNGKFNMLNPLNRKFGLAFAPRVSTNLLGDIFSLSNSDYLYTAIVPLIFSYHVNRNLAFILAEQYMFASYGEFNSPFSHAFSVEYGKNRFKVLLGVTYRYTDYTDVFYTGVGMKFYFGDSKPVVIEGIDY